MHDVEAQMIQSIQQGLSQEDHETLQTLDWKQVKQKKEWKHVFEQAAIEYNAALKKTRQEQERRQQQLPQIEALPRLFRLKDDDNTSVFYVNAALAQRPDLFAMKILVENNNGNDKNKLPIVGGHDDSAAASTTSSGNKLQYRLALTRCTILHHYTLAGHPVTKVQLEPWTGRRHQLRCHMLVAGVPIVGDVTYTSGESLTKRMCLHAYQLVVPGIGVNVTAPDPFPVEKTSSNE
jgi:hypothetical protein